MSMHKTIKSILTSLMALACLGTHALAQNASEALLPIQQNGKWGYIERVR